MTNGSTTIQPGDKRSNPGRLVVLGAGLFLALVLALGLAWISSDYSVLSGWPGFFVMALVSAGLLAGGWWAVRGEAPPRWLAWLLLGAALLRLGAGVLWFTALPSHGYNSAAEQGGYVMADAYERDTAAWDLAQSGKPLLRAFQGAYRRVDQYGGMLFLSAAVYRFLAGNSHPPLLLVVLTAAFSSLAVLFTWAFVRRAWGGAAAALAAWVMALYPDAVLLGSSQMREAFTITLVTAAFYGLLRYWQERRFTDLLWVFAALLLSLPFSPPMTGLLLVVLGIQAFALRRDLLRAQSRVSRRTLLILLGLIAVLVVAGVWLSWANLAPEGVTNPLALFSWWLKKSADWQAHLSERASGWVQKNFDNTPAWTHAIQILVMGIAQPFLPAALSSITSAPFWQAVAIWRALGWTLLLPFMLYAPLRALRRRQIAGSLDRDSVFGAGALSLGVWLVILVASFRGGGDLWDNPRYRAAFASLQIGLMAWVWVAQRRSPDLWLQRILVGFGLLLLWFLPWYLRRYFHLPWPVEDFFKTVVLGLLSAAIFWLGDWAAHQPDA